ncbi:glycyl-tRNA synthetase [Blastomyces parvus]|uniref:Guanine nucleotide-exchange factor SEC12 n=1 Tax=Blastomyces parvus TaxID=2060905 RepID=A0A2B7WPI2_9EURO|nr:glycyl-tRNA synthetase [Blastomyces parvus]
MAPHIPSAKITLSCPLFGADFDPRNNNFLLVGGGGGEGRSGTLLNTSRRNEISEIVDIELSRDEDSVTSLAVSKSNDKSIIALAGINSSVAEQQKDNNEHLRSFQLDYPPRQAPAGSTASPAKSEKGGKKRDTQPARPTTTPLARASLFKPKYKPKERRETYQRLLRLSPWKGEEAPRIGAVATGLAPDGEMVVFDATSSTPGESDILGRIWLEGKDEVEDVDMLPGSEGGDGKFKVAFTDGTSIYTFKVSASTKSNATPKIKAVYTLPFPDYFAGTKKRSKIRALRFLSPTSFLVLLNHPDRTGCELAIISLGFAPEGTVVRRTRLPRAMKIGLGLDVCPLSESAMGTKQSIIAVSGNDNSIQILTLEYTRKPKNPFGKFRPYATLRDVHPFSMTRLVFSTFTPPSQPVSADVRPQYVKLASISVGNTVVVHSLPLAPSPPKSRNPRYVLVQPGSSELLQTLFSGFMALIVVALGAFFLQAFTEIRGGVPPTLGAQEWLSPKIRSMIARPYLWENGLSSQYQKWRSPTDTDTDTAAASSSVSISMTKTTATSTTNIPVVLTTPTLNLRDLLSSLSTAVPEATPTPETPGESAPGSIKIIVHEHPDDPSLITVTAVPHTPGDGDSDKNRGKTRKWEDLHDHEREAWKEKLSAAGHWVVEEGEAILRGLFFGQVAGAMAGAVGGAMD